MKKDILKKLGLTAATLKMAIGGIFALLIFVTYLFLFRPILKEMKVASRECERVEKELAEARREVASLKNMDVSLSLGSKEKITSAIDEITRVGKRGDIDFISITPRPLRTDPPYLILPLAMEIESTYEKMAVFLGALDDLGQNLVEVESFELIPNLKDAARFKKRLVADIYFLDNKNGQ